MMFPERVRAWYGRKLVRMPAGDSGGDVSGDDIRTGDS